MLEGLLEGGASIALAARIAKLKDRKRELNELIAQRRRDVVAAKRELPGIRNDIQLYRDFLEAHVKDKIELGC